MTFESSYHVRVKTLYKALCVRHCQGSKNEIKQTKKNNSLYSYRGLNSLLEEMHVHLTGINVNDNNSKINT